MWLVFSTLLVAGGVVIAAALMRDHRRQEAEARLMLAEGREAEGAVMRLWRSGDDSDQHLVAYRFALDDGEHRGEAAIDSGHWDRLREGSTILVRYLPSSPAHNYPSADPPGVDPAWPGFAVGGIPIAIGALPAILVWSRRRLLAHGLPARAVVTGVRKVQAGDSEVQAVDYEFPLAGGGTRKGNFNVSSDPPPEGSVFCVLYDPHGPGLNERYPLGSVEVAAD